MKLNKTLLGIEMLAMPFLLPTDATSHQAANHEPLETTSESKDTQSLSKNIPTDKSADYFIPFIAPPGDGDPDILVIGSLGLIVAILGTYIDQRDAQQEQNNPNNAP